MYIYVCKFKKMCKQNKLLSSLYTRWITTEFLEGGLLKLMSNILSVVHCEQSQYNQEYCKLKKKNFLTGVFQKILFIDTEKLSKMQISLQVFFKDFADRFRITYLKNGFFWSCFSKILSTDFKIATNLKARLSKTWSWKILFIDFNPFNIPCISESCIETKIKKKRKPLKPS